MHQVLLLHAIPITSQHTFRLITESLFLVITVCPLTNHWNVHWARNLALELI